jgi:hypothetical protein
MENRLPLCNDAGVRGGATDKVVPLHDCIEFECIE